MRESPTESSKKCQTLLQMPASRPPAPTTTQNVDLAAKLPENIKSAGVIKIGTDSTYPPSEFLAADGKTIQGFDVDIFNAAAGKLGVATEWKSASFDSIIP